jgi:hypothetical protein
MAQALVAAAVVAVAKVAQLERVVLEEVLPMPYTCLLMEQMVTSLKQI